MVLEAVGRPLVFRTLEDPVPAAHEVRVRVTACGVCRTDLHVVDGELPDVRVPIVPGHEIVGRVDRLGSAVPSLKLGERVGIPWLGHTCGACRYCQSDHENLCDQPVFTGYSRNGGYATYAIADARFALPLGESGSDQSIAPFLCAGLIGWRSLVKAGEAAVLGIYGFGAAGHLIAQVALAQGRTVFAFTRAGDTKAQALARRLGVQWAGAAEDVPPAALDSAIIFAPSGELIPRALKAVRKGGRVVCAGIHMSDIPSFPYADLWGEREIVSVANLTHRDGLEFLPIARRLNIRAETTAYPLRAANEALDDLRSGRLNGAAVLVMDHD